MPVRLDCPSCRKPINVGDALIGKAIRCPHCQVVIPAAASQSAAAGNPAAAAAPPPASIRPPTPEPILDVLPAGPAPGAGQPSPPPQQTNPTNIALIVIAAVCGAFFIFALVIVVCLAAIQILGAPASVTFSTVGQPIDWKDLDR